MYFILDHNSLGEQLVMYYQYVAERINHMLNDKTSDIEIHLVPHRHTIGNRHTVLMAPNQTVHDVFSALDALLEIDNTYQKIGGTCRMVKFIFLSY